MGNFAIYNVAFESCRYIRINYQGNIVTCLKRVDNPADFGIKTDLTEKIFTQLIEYFSGKRKVFAFPYKVEGTAFQKKVWQALCDIPYGETRSYRDIAVAVGNRKASRAVGMANNKNQMAIVVPCHRVVGARGDLVGYAGGLEMKRSLLAMEQANQ